MPLRPLGSTAVLVDPAGAVFGLWEAGELTGFGRYDEPGSEVADLLDPTGAPFKLHSSRLKNPSPAQEPQLS